MYIQMMLEWRVSSLKKNLPLRVKIEGPLYDSWSENQKTSIWLPEMVWWWTKLAGTFLELVGSLLCFEIQKDFGVGSSNSEMANTVDFDADSEFKEFWEVLGVF